MATAFDVWNKAHPPAVVTQADWDRAIDKAVKDAQSINALNQKLAAERAELDELASLFQAVSSVPSAESDLAQVRAQASAVTEDYKAKVAAAKGLLKEEGLTAFERRQLSQRVEVLEGELADFKRTCDFKERQATARLAQAKAAAPRRARYEELKAKRDRLLKALA